MNNQSNKHIWFAGIAIIAVLMISGYMSYSLTKKPKISFVQAKKSDITQGVSLDGLVQSSQDLSLAFEQGGTVSAVNVKEGDTVKKGQVLVKLDSGNSAASVSQASAALASAQANYQKLLNGATGANVNVAQTTLDNAQTALKNTQAQQQVLVNNALQSMMNAGLTAVGASNNSGNVTATISGTYTGADQGAYSISLYSTGGGLHFQIGGLESGDGIVSTSPQPLGSKGLYLQFSGISIPAGNTWTVNIPNTQSALYIINNNAYQTALQNQKTATDAAQSAVNSAQASLALMQTPPRPEDVASASAQVQTASAVLQTAQNAYGKTSLVAPIDGIITLVNVKVGQTVAGSTIAQGPSAIKMISDQKLQITAYVSEADLGKLKVGDSAKTTLDAYGNGTNFDATVVSIDPGATVTNGVSTYKVTLQFNNNDDRIKTGMNANVSIIDQTDRNALVIPSTAIIKKNNQTFVLADAGNGKIVQTQVQTGITGLGNIVEILSGLTEGQNVAYFGN